MGQIRLGGPAPPPQVGGHAPGTEQCFAYDSIIACMCVCLFGGWVGAWVRVCVCLVCVSVCAVFFFTYWWSYCKVLSALKTSAIVNIL